MILLGKSWGSSRIRSRKSWPNATGIPREMCFQKNTCMKTALPSSHLLETSFCLVQDSYCPHAAVPAAKADVVMTGKDFRKI